MYYDNKKLLDIGDMDRSRETRPRLVVAGPEHEAEAREVREKSLQRLVDLYRAHSNAMHAVMDQMRDSGTDEALVEKFGGALAGVLFAWKQRLLEVEGLSDDEFYAALNRSFDSR